MEFLHRLFLGVLDPRQVIGQGVFIDDAQRFGKLPVILGVDVVTHLVIVIEFGALTNQALAEAADRIGGAAFFTRKGF